MAVLTCVMLCSPSPMRFKYKPEPPWKCPNKCSLGRIRSSICHQPQPPQKHKRVLYQYRQGREPGEPQDTLSCVAAGHLPTAGSNRGRTSSRRMSSPTLPLGSSPSPMPRGGPCVTRMSTPVGMAAIFARSASPDSWFPGPYCAPCVALTSRRSVSFYDECQAERRERRCRTPGS